MENTPKRLEWLEWLEWIDERNNIINKWVFNVI